MLFGVDDSWGEGRFEAEYPDNMVSLERLVWPYPQHRKLHLYLRRQIRGRLDRHELPPSWRLPKGDPELAAQLEAGSQRFSVPVKNLRWLLFEKIRNSWTRKSRAPSTPPRLQRLLLSPSSEEDLEEHQSFLLWLYDIVTARPPDLTQLTAVVTSLLDLIALPFEKKLADMERLVGEGAESLDLIRKWIGSGRGYLPLTVVGAAWQQLWGDADGLLFETFTRRSTGIPAREVYCGGPDALGSRIGRLVTRFVDEGRLSGLAEEIGRGVIGRSRVAGTVDPPAQSAPVSPARSSRPTASPSKTEQQETGAEEAGGAQGRVAGGGAASRRAREREKPAPAKTKRKAKRRRRTEERREIEPWLGESPKGLHTVTATELWKAALKLRTFTRRQLQEESGKGVGPAKKFLKFAEDEGKLHADRAGRVSKIDPLKYRVIRR